MQKETQQTFRQYCEDVFCKTDFDELHQTIKTTKYKITYYLNHPEKVPFDTLIAFSKALEIPPKVLFHDFKVSQDMLLAKDYFKLEKHLKTDEKDNNQENQKQ